MKPSWVHVRTLNLSSGPINQFVCYGCSHHHAEYLKPGEPEPEKCFQLLGCTLPRMEELPEMRAAA